MVCLTSPCPGSCAGGRVRMEEAWATEPGSPSATMLLGRLGLQRCGLVCACVKDDILEVLLLQIVQVSIQCCACSSFIV